MTENQENQEIVGSIADDIIQIFYDYNIPMIANAVYKVILTLSEKRGVRNETIIAKQEKDDVPQFADWQSRYGSQSQ